VFLGCTGVASSLVSRCSIDVKPEGCPEMRSVRDIRNPSIRSEMENASSDDDVGEWRS